MSYVHHLPSGQRVIGSGSSASDLGMNLGCPEELGNHQWDGLWRSHSHLFLPMAPQNAPGLALFPPPNPKSKIVAFRSYHAMPTRWSRSSTEDGGVWNLVRCEIACNGLATLCAKIGTCEFEDSHKWPLGCLLQTIPIVCNIVLTWGCVKF